MFQVGRKALLSALFFALTAHAVPVSAYGRSIHLHHSRHCHTRHLSARRGAGGRVIQCVAFAKQDAGIDIAGNARDWWANAEGVYQRGQRPEIGSVLSFRANGRMPLGHVAVVSGMADSRTITIDQAHWNSRGITRDIEVKDVSDGNDWSAVRVQLVHEGNFGSIYPTHGFIYARADDGGAVRGETQVADAPRVVRHASAVLEVAAMPVARRGLDLRVSGSASDAPDRDFR